MHACGEMRHVLCSSQGLSHSWFQLHNYWPKNWTPLGRRKLEYLGHLLSPDADAIALDDMLANLVQMVGQYNVSLNFCRRLEFKKFLQAMAHFMHTS